MKLSAHTDLATTVNEAFAVLSDFVQFEKIALRQGAEVERTDSLRGYGIGSTWSAHFRFRGKARHLVTELTQLEPPRVLGFRGKSNGFEFSVVLSLLPLAQHITRLNVDVDVRPRTLAARIVLQTAKLGRARIEQRFVSRIAAFGRFLQQRLA